MRSKVHIDRQTVREILELVWFHATPFIRRRFALVLALVLAAAILAPLGPVALKLVVDNFTGQSTFQTLSIGLAVGLYVLSQWLSRSIGEIRGLVYARAERRMFTIISDVLFTHVIGLPLRYHLQRATGAVNQTRENGLQGLQMILHHLIFTALPVAAQLVTTVWILFRIDQPLFLTIFCAAVACYAVAFTFFVVRSTKSAEDASAAAVDASALMTDSIMAYETVKFFAAENMVRTRVREALNATEDRWVRFYRAYAVNGLVVATIFASFLALAIALAAREVAAGRMTVGEFILINTYMLQMMQPVEMLGYAIQGFSQGAAMLGKMMALLREAPETDAQLASSSTLKLNAWNVLGQDCRRTRDVVPGRQLIVERRPIVTPAAIEFRGISLSYDDNRSVLRDVSFVLPAGQTLGIVGTSGAGKSTIVRLLVRLFDPDAGTILLDGTPTHALALAELRRAIAVVPQDTVLFNETLRYNISFGRSGCTQAEIEDAARLAHLHDFIVSLPDKYDTRVGERGVKLSGGEKQRVSIARAALKSPRLYVFDEATSSLDSATEREIVTNLRQISRACTTMIIAHRLSTIAHADQIIVLDAGEIVERGRHAELIARGGKYAALWNAQQAGPTAAHIATVQ
jgi:ABC-type transport system involved in Fe-S cluster assembly fused permease/ATPase subunit